MDIAPAPPGTTCMTSVGRPIPNGTSFGYCDAPAVVEFETWAGRVDRACRDHASELLRDLLTALDLVSDPLPAPIRRYVRARQVDGGWAHLGLATPNLIDLVGPPEEPGDRILLLVAGSDPVEYLAWREASGCWDDPPPPDPPFLVRRKHDPVTTDRSSLWRAWPVDHGFQFTRNDGRTMHSIGRLAHDEFWAEFDRVPIPKE